jgi:organic hydroperoxide reductase OsmC/OhrA
MAVAMAPIASAATPDDQFLGAVAALGVQGPPDQLIASGHAACDNWGHVWAVYGIRLNIQNQFGASVEQAAGVIRAGVKAYCPENGG